MYWTLYSGPITYSARVPCTLCHKKPGTDGCCSSVLRVIPCLFCLSCILRSVRHWIWYLCSTYGWTDRWGVNVCDSLLHKCFLLSDVCEWLIELGVCRMCFGYLVVQLHPLCMVHGWVLLVSTELIAERKLLLLLLFLCLNS